MGKQNNYGGSEDSPDACFGGPSDAPRDTVYETGPVARAHHSAAVTKHGSLVIFGGVSQQRLPQPCSFNAVS